MAQTIDQGRLCDHTGRSDRPLWTELDLARADARIVAELARRIEIWTVATGGDAEAGAQAAHHDLSEQTVRELLAVVHTLTRRESSRRGAHRTE